MVTLLDRTSQARPEPSARHGKARLPRSQPVTVNGRTISRAEIARETQHHPASRPIDAWQAAARALVVRELLLQEARRLAIEPRPMRDDEGRRETDEEALIRALIDAQITLPEADEDTCRRIYDRNPDSFRSSDLFAVRHILFPAPAGDEGARARARARAEAILAHVQQAPADFAALAKDNSACPSAANGGALGQICRGQTVPEFEAALPGIDGLGLIETRYGFHVVAVDDHLAGRRLPFDAVKSQIADRLTERARHAAVRDYVGMLAGNAQITGIDLVETPSGQAG